MYDLWVIQVEIITVDSLDELVAHPGSPQLGDHVLSALGGSHQIDNICTHNGFISL